MSQRFVRAALVFAAVSLNVSACTDITATSTTLNVADKTALTSAIANSGSLSATPLAAFAGLLVNTLGTVGSLSATDNSSAFSAVGLEIIYDVTHGGVHSVGTFTGVFGWTGLNATTNSVDALIEAVIATNTSSPATGTVAISSVPTSFPAAEAFYATHNAGGTYTSFIGTTGNVTVTNADFSGTNSDCAAGTAGVNCNVSSGTISGSFNFGSIGISNPNLTFTQGNTTFTSLPAVKIQITVTQ